MKTILVGIAAFVAMGVVLSGCAYKPLKAPCAPEDSGRPLAYADAPMAQAVPEPFGSLDACGPMKPIEDR